jgi:hypothetical protein
MEMFGDVDYSQQKLLPYGTSQLLKELPLAPTSRVGEVAGEIGSVAPITPMEALQAARLARQTALAGGRVAKQGARLVGEEFNAAMMGQRPNTLLGAITPKPMFAVEPNANLLATSVGKERAAVSPLGFYSAVEQQSLNIPRKQGTGASFLNDLMKGQDVKKYEIEAMGLEDFLKDKPNVTRQEVQDFIKNNRINIQEVQLGQLTPELIEKGRQDAISHLNAMSKSQLEDAYEKVTWGRPSNDWGDNWFSRKNEVIQQMLNPELESNYLDKFVKAGATKFESYTLPGGENYREILLTTPVRGKSELDAAQIAAGDLRRQTADLMEQWKTASELNPGDPSVVALYQKVADSRRLRDQAEATAQELKNNIKSQTYQSSHFDEPNILAHMRVNDRVDAEGKKMLLIEEVQSDWHQAGRDKGYKTPEFERNLKEYETLAQKYANTQKITPEERARIEELKPLVSGKSEGVPDAPFKDTWHQLAFKRAIKEAVDKGYDRIGLTTGAQQADRFDLSKQVDAVSYHPDDRGRGMMLNVFGKNNEIIYSKLTPENKVADVIGKETAKKLLAKEAVDDNRMLEGLDLKVGGEGMKKYYDEIYPNFLNKFGKKYGAQIKETTIPTGRSQDANGIPSMYPDKETIRYLDITPEMRDAVKKGQPLASITNQLANSLA